MESKRKVSILIPYKVQGGEILVYLQKRGKNAQRLPDYFGFFGGGAEERESSEETLRREIEEEMSFTPTGYTFLARYEFERSIKDIFFLEADDSFEDRVTTQEGEYGRYFTQEEVAAEPKLIEKDKMVLRDLYRVLGAPHSI